MMLLSALAKAKGFLRERNRRTLAQKHLAGNGIEIGALDNFLRVSPKAAVQYVDRMSKEELLKQYPHLLNRNIQSPDIVDDGENLFKFEESSLDFIIANHFIEHCEDPIGTLKTFFSRLRKGGVIYMAVPNKNHNLDKKRPLTSLDHLWKDHTEGPIVSRQSHYEEATEHWHFKRRCSQQELKEVSGALMRQGYSIHFHVWDSKSFSEFISFFRRKTALEISTLCRKNNFDETIFVIQKD